MSEATDRLAVAHRAEQAALSLTVARDLAVLWPALDLTRLDATYPAWLLSVARLVEQRKHLSAQLAGSYLAELRSLLGLPPAAVAFSTGMDAEQFVTSMQVTSVVAVKRAMAAGKPLAEAGKIGLVMSTGSASRLVLNGGRETILDTIRDDPRVIGWRRVTRANPCPFCEMLAGRGVVYKVDTVDFQPHDHCACFPEPGYRA